MSVYDCHTWHKLLNFEINAWYLSQDFMIIYGTQFENNADK